MSESFGHQPFPRAPLLGAAILIGLCMATVALVRITGVGATHNPDAAAVTQRQLRFEDRADGGIAVYEGRDSQVLEVVTGANGFLRGTLRGLARERKRQGISPDLPFVLTGRADGRLTLEDPSTQRRVDLESFGPTNAAVFAQILMTERSAR